MNRRGKTGALLLAAMLGLTGHVPAATQSWHYTLIEGSRLIDDCPVCDRPVIPVPIRGRFDLTLLEENPLFSRYRIENLQFHDQGGGTLYKVTGQGTYQIGGEVALTQELVLETFIDDGTTNAPVFFTNATSTVARWWPMLQIVADQTNGTLVRTYQLEIVAAPLRDLWFSTTHGMTPGDFPVVTNYISSGDLVSWYGRVVKRNRELTASTLPEGDGDPGLDAFDVLPGGEIVFSTDISDASSHGALRFWRSGATVEIGDLLRPLIGGEPAFNPGLDAAQISVAGDQLQFLFSIETNLIIFQDPEPNLVLQPGDILFSDALSEGRVHKRHEELLARFHPAPGIGADYGVDALYIWPNGEIWFSVEEGFDDGQLGLILPGDLLSDQGYIVFRNLELVAAFSPLEDLVDFGLDALFIVTDVTAPAPAPELRLSLERASGDVTVTWQGRGHVFQLERALDVTGPYLPVTPIVPDLSFMERGVAKPARAFYRLRQW